MRRGCVSPSMSKGSMTPATGRTQTSLVMMDDGVADLDLEQFWGYLCNISVKAISSHTSYETLI